MSTIPRIPIPSSIFQVTRYRYREERSSIPVVEKLNRGQTKVAAAPIHFVPRHLSARIYFSKARLENNPASSPKLKSINTIHPSPPLPLHHAYSSAACQNKSQQLQECRIGTYNEIFTSRLRDCDEITPCFSTTRFPSPTHRSYRIPELE